MVIRKRNVLILKPVRTVGTRIQKILVALERYDHLDTKHLLLLTGLTYDNIEAPLRDAFHAGLVDRPPQLLYRRDRLKDPQVYKRAAIGTDWLERHQLVPARAIYRAAGGQPPHDLAVSQILACVEVAHNKAGLRFFTQDEILAQAPGSADFRFEMRNPRQSGH